MSIVKKSQSQVRSLTKSFARLSFPSLSTSSFPRSSFLPSSSSSLSSSSSSSFSSSLSSVLFSSPHRSISHSWHGKVPSVWPLPLDVSVKSYAISKNLPRISLSRRHQCDFELIVNGGLSPLQGFMGKADYDSVVNNMRLADGTLFPLPITLDVSDSLRSSLGISVGSEVSLLDGEGNILGVMTVTDMWKPDKTLEAQKVFGGDPEHPAIVYLNNEVGNWYLGGKIRPHQYPPHYDHTDLRQSPTELRNFFNSNPQWRDNPIVGFQTRNPLHRAHFELTVRACQSVQGGNLLLHPVVGMTKPGDIDHHTRVKCYRAIMKKYDEYNTPAKLSALPLAMRMAGPREAILHAIIRQNYGCSHFIIGRDHAGPGSNSKGKEFYTAYEARDEALKYQSELKIQLLPFEMMVYVDQVQKYFPVDKVPEGMKSATLSGTEVRRRLAKGAEIPEWFSFKEVVKILQNAHPPTIRQGFCVFFTGLSGSGKSTIANALVEYLMSVDDRRVSLLDGDLVRQHLSSELGFSAEHRNLNITRIGYVSSLIVKNGGAAIAAPIAPFASSRAKSRQMVSEYGGFVEVFLSTPIDICEKRDRKGLYLKARQGKLQHFTGIDDPYEAPTNPEIVINSGEVSVADAVKTIVQHLVNKGFIKPIEGQ